MNKRSEKIFNAVIIFSLMAMLFSPCHFGPAKSLMTSIALCSGQGQVDQDIAVVDNYIQAVQSNNAQAVRKLLDDSYVGYLPSLSNSIGKEQVLENLTYESDRVYQKIEFVQNVHLSVRAMTGSESVRFVSDSCLVKITYKDGRSVFLNMLVDYRIAKGKITFSSATSSNQLSLL